MPAPAPVDRADERAALHRVAGLLTAGAGLDRICAIGVQEMGRCVGAQTASIFRFDGPETPVLLASWGAGFSLAPGLHDELCSAYRTGLPARAAAATKPLSPSGEPRDTEVSSWVLMPVAVAERLWGVLYAATSVGDPFPADTEARMAAFADLMAAAVAQDQAYANLSLLAEEQAVLRRLAIRVARGASRDDVLNTIAAEAHGLFDVEFTALLRYDRAGAAFIVARHNAPPSLDIGERAPDVPDGLVARVFRSGRPARVEAYADLDGPGITRVHRLGITAGAAAPILVDGSLRGVIAAMQRSGTVAAGLQDRLAAFAEVAATAVSAAQANADLRRLADEQAALRRVAELVARGAALDEVFTAVTAEASTLLGELAAVLLRYNPDDSATCVAACNSTVPLGVRVLSGPDPAADEPVRTGPSVLADDRGDAVLAEITQNLGGGAAVAVPVSIEGRIWGALTIGTRGRPIPAGIEERLAPFADLAAAAIANAENKAQLTASRARVVATADETRRRLQRDVHDGAQQRLVHAIITLKLARDAVDRPSAVADLVGEALYHAERANTELRDLVHGILPVSLSSGGLRVGLESLIENFPIPVRLQLNTSLLPPDIETTAYFFVAEALTNVTKHSRADHADIIVDVTDDSLALEVRDDGSGGADPRHGTGLIGLADRVEAANGALTITSTTEGTTLRARLPLVRS